MTEPKNALQVTITYFIIATLVLVTESYFLIQIRQWQLVVMVVLAAVAMIMSGYSIYQVRKGHPDLAIKLLVFISLSSILAAPFFVAGLGLISGLGTVLIVLMMALQTLSSQAINRYLTFSVGTAIVAGIIDLIAPETQLTVPYLHGMMKVLGGLMISTFVLFTVLQFRSYSLPTKLIVTFLSVSLIPLGLMASLNDFYFRSALTEDANQALSAAASQTAASIDAFITANLDNIRTEAHLPTFMKYLELPEEERTGSIEEEEVQSILETLKLRDRLFITSYALLDREGKILLSTDPSEMEQTVGQYEYFTEPIETGLPYVSQVKFFSEQPKQAALYFTSPIRPEPDETIGLLRLHYKPVVLEQLVIKNNELMGEKSFAVLLDQNHIQLAHGQQPEHIFKTLVPLEPERMKELQEEGFLPQKSEEEEESLFTNIPGFEEGLVNYYFNQPYFSTSLNETGEIYWGAIAQTQKQPWFVVFFQSQQVLLAPIQTQTQTILFFAIVIAGIVVVSASFLGQKLAAPLVHLTGVVTQFTEGNLDARSNIQSKDETGVLAISFNKMAEQVSKLLNRLEERTRELEGEIFERKRAETALREHREQLEEQVVARTAELTTTNQQLQQEISERKRAEKELLQKNEYLAALHETALGLISRLDLNDLLETLISRAGQLLGTEHGYIYLLEEDPEDFLELKVGSGIFRKYLGDRISKGEGISGKVWKRGELLTVDNYDTWSGRAMDFDYNLVSSVTAMPLKSEREVVGVLGMAYSPKTGQTFTEGEIELLNRFAQLASIALDNARLYTSAQQEILERKRTHKALVKAKEEAEAANRAKSSFLATVTHELRTPLNAIMGYSDMLREDVENLGYRELLSDILRIWNAGNHLLSIINDILDLSKIESGRMDFYLEKFDLATFAQDMEITVQPLVRKNNNKLFIYCEDVGTMYADPRRVHQILLNLLGNAAKFTEEGEIALTITREKDSGDHQQNSIEGQPHSLIDDGHSGKSSASLEEIDRLIFQIKDTGIGMTEAQMENIFKPFIQVDTSTTRKYEGTGLGLAISHRLCQMMNGKITVESELGKGSTFTVCLPARIEDEQMRSVSYF